MQNGNLNGWHAGKEGRPNEGRTEWEEEDRTALQMERATVAENGRESRNCPGDGGREKRRKQNRSGVFRQRRSHNEAKWREGLQQIRNPFPYEAHNITYVRLKREIGRSKQIALRRKMHRRP